MHVSFRTPSLLLWLCWVSVAFSVEPIEAERRLSEPVTLSGDIGRLADIQFSPDGKLLAAGGYFSDSGGADVAQGGFGLWDVASGRRADVRFGDLPAEFRPRLRDYPYLNFRSVAFSPNGKLLATGIGAYQPKDGKFFIGTLILWNIETGERKAVLPGHTDQVTSIQFSPDGLSLASAGDDQTVRLWDVASAEATATLSGHTSGVQQVCFSRDGKALASTGGHDKSVRLWDIGTGKEIAVLVHDEMVSSAAFSPDGRSVATSGHDRRDGFGDHIRLWDTRTAELKAKLHGHTGEIRDIAFSPDGRLLASVGGDSPGTSSKSESGGEVKLWDAVSGEELASFKNKDQFTCAAFSPDGRRLAAGSLDATIRVWDLPGTASEVERN